MEPAVPWVGAGEIELYGTLIALRGSSFAAIFFLSNSIAADVIDQDTLDTGKQRTGLFFALWGMALKLAVALGVLMGTDFRPCSVSSRLPRATRRRRSRR